MSDSTWYYNERLEQLGCWVQVGSENRIRTRKYFCVVDNDVNCNYGMNRLNDKLQTVPDGYEPITNISFIIKMFNEKRFPSTKISISRAVNENK